MLKFSYSQYIEYTFISIYITIFISPSLAKSELPTHWSVSVPSLYWSQS